MENSQILNLGPNPAGTSNHEATRPAEDRAHTGDLIEQTRSDVRRMRMQLERQADEQDFHSRRTRILSILLGVLIVVLAGAFWYAYPTLRNQEQGAIELLRLKSVANSLGGGIESLEAKLNETVSGLPELTTRMDQLQASMKSTLQSARSQAQTAATQVGERIRTDFNQTLQAVQSRLAGLESNQHEASQRVTQLQEQIAGLKQELASMREESAASAAVMQQLRNEQQARASVLSSLDERMASHQSALDSLSSRVDRNRTEFDLPSRQTEEIVPGIYLTVRRTDAKKQEVDGTLQLGTEARMIAIRAQGIQNPVVFYSENETRPMELVFTQVAKNRVAGYVVTPAPVINATRADRQ